MVVRGVMRRSVPRFIVDHDGFAVRGNIFAGSNCGYLRPQLGQLVTLLRGGGH